MTHPDAKIFDLDKKLTEYSATRPQGADNASLDRWVGGLCELEDRLAKAPAKTLQGLRVKAALVAHLTHEQFLEGGDQLSQAVLALVRDIDGLTVPDA